MRKEVARRQLQPYNGSLYDVAPVHPLSEQQEARQEKYR